MAEWYCRCCERTEQGPGTARRACEACESLMDFQRPQAERAAEVIERLVAVLDGIASRARCEATRVCARKALAELHIKEKLNPNKGDQDANTTRSA